jgi:ketosteroid isomerase-like protein
MEDSQWRTSITDATRLIDRSQMTIHDYFASEEERRAWVHCSMTADRKGSEGLYEMEYMFVLTFDLKGENITKIVEMMDSHRVREAWGKVSAVDFNRE